jgi:uncharacterized membrane protein YkoI
MKCHWIVKVGSGAIMGALVVVGVGFAKSDGGDVREGTIRIENQVEADFPAMARIKTDQAIQAALRAVQGRILKTELENEDGFLVYGVEVVTPSKTIMDVKVDAGTGKVLAMEKDPEDNDDHGPTGRDDVREVNDTDR